MTQWVRPGDPLMTHWVILGDPFMAEMQKEHKPGLWLSKDSSFVCVVGVYERLPSKLSILSFFEKQCGMWFTYLNLSSSNQSGLHRWPIFASYVRSLLPVRTWHNKWQGICSSCRKHATVLSFFMTYHRMCK